MSVVLDPLANDEYGEGSPEATSHIRLVDDVEVVSISRTGATVKRALDISVALVALIVLLPIIVVVAVLVGCTSRGPVLFTQERIGRNGRTFRILKFRTMVNGTHDRLMECESQRALYTANDFKLQPDDPRITKVGRVLRALSLDELPQFLNVVAGQMSLVGIRPLLAAELELRSPRDRDLYRLMRPGMTGLWQVTGRSMLVADRRHLLDRQYVESWSLWSDTKILLRTPLAVVRTKHAR